MNGTNVIKFNPITIPDPPFDEPLNPSHVPYARATKNRVHMRHVGNSGKVSAVGFEFIEANLRRSDFSDMFDRRIREIQMETTTCRSIAEKPIFATRRQDDGRQVLNIRKISHRKVKNIWLLLSMNHLLVTSGSKESAALKKPFCCVCCCTCTEF